MPRNNERTHRPLSVPLAPSIRASEDLVLVNQTQSRDVTTPDPKMKKGSELFPPGSKNEKPKTENNRQIVVE
jgi:hypothetical protein